LRRRRAVATASAQTFAGIPRVYRDTATSGSEALKLFQQNTVDLVIVDHFMPGRPGASVARQMKQLKPDTPVIIFSAYQSLPNEVLGIAEAVASKSGNGTRQILSRSY
jgi:CheY-like chemotaxis protein